MLLWNIQAFVRRCNCCLHFKELFHAFCYQKAKIFLAFVAFKNNGPVLLFKTIFKHWNCLLSPVSTDGKDGYGLRLEKVGPTFSSFITMPEKIIIKYYE